MRARIKETISDYELVLMLKSKDEEMYGLAESIIRHHISRDIVKFHSKYNILIENEEAIIETATEDYIKQLLKAYE